MKACEEITRSNRIQTVCDQQYGDILGSFNINNLKSHNSKRGSNGRVMLKWIKGITVK